MNRLKIIITLSLLLSSLIYILYLCNPRNEVDKGYILPPSDREFDSIEKYPIIDTKAYIIDGDTLATENI
jgi:hypothetical protein